MISRVKKSFLLAGCVVLRDVGGLSLKGKEEALEEPSSGCFGRNELPPGWRACWTHSGGPRHVQGNAH